MNDSRTWLVSVLFLDIIGYSKVPVDQQMAIKLHFKEVVSKSLESLEIEDCIQLDTGDGCAICYLGDPEKLYPVAIQLRSIFADLQMSDTTRYQVRLGLNLGPVKILDGISGERNCVGAGINDAQRVMDFAGENELLVSKSYYDIVSNMSSSYAEQLSHAGSRADKHDKVHEIYELSSERSETGIPQVLTAAGFDLDEDVKKQLTQGFAKFVGTDEAVALIQQKLAEVTSLAALCEILAQSLSEDDRYHFNEFTRYYGYSSY